MDNDYFINSHHHNEHYESRHYSGHHERSQSEVINDFMISIKNNPKLKVMLIIAAIILIVLVIVAISLLFPVLLKLLGYVEKNGLQGVVNALWNGSK